jgi:hypothetical protein
MTMEQKRSIKKTLINRKEGLFFMFAVTVVQKYRLPVSHAGKSHSE